VNILVTGASGFVGRHLIRYLKSAEHEIWGTCFPERPGNLEPDIKKNIYYLDIRDGEGVSKIVEKVRPAWIFHLAAISNVRHSWEKPRETILTNLMGTFNIFEAVRKHVGEARILFASSSDVYGTTSPSGRALREEDSTIALNPYAYTKLSGEMMSVFYSRVEKLKIIIVRSFPHTGPGQMQDFVCSDWAFQIARIEKKFQDPVLHVGNMEVKRDYSDVRDVVRAYALLMEKGRLGEIYNVCSGKAVSLGEILDFLLSLTSKSIRVKKDSQKMRKADIPMLVGDNQKIREETGWMPEITLEESLRDLLHDWRFKVEEVKSKK